MMGDVLTHVKPGSTLNAPISTRPKIGLKSVKRNIGGPRAKAFTAFGACLVGGVGYMCSGGDDS